MKKQVIFFSFMAAVLIISASALQLTLGKDPDQDKPVKYKNGTYEGQSRFNYTDEPYWGRVRITLRKGSIKEIHFVIRDSAKHETFDQKYEKHFEGIPEYIQQCRNDWNGVQTYPKKLLESMDINKLDAISGATWSYNIFKASTQEALKKALKY